MRRISNEQGAAQGERSDTGAGRKDGLGSDLTASLTTLTQPKVGEPPFDRQLSTLNSPVPPNLLSLCRKICQ